MAESTSASDLLPDVRLSDVLQQRHGGLGSKTLVARLAVAVTVSWLIAGAVSQSPLGIFAPVTTLLVVQGSPWSTLGLSLQRILGTGVGVLAASIWVNLVGLSWWSFFLAVLAALLVARLVPWSIAGQMQIPVAVVFVLALGAGSMRDDVWRVLDVVIGGATGLIAVYVYPPRPRPHEFEGALERYRDAILDVLERVGAESGSQPELLPDGVNHAYVDQSRALRQVAEVARQALTKLAESAQWNPRGRWVQRRLQDDARRLRRMGGMAVQVRGVAGAANLLFDRDDASRLPVAVLREVIDRLLSLAGEALGQRGEPVASSGIASAPAPNGDRSRAAILSDDLARFIRDAADELPAAGRGVGHSLESVSLLGRLDHIRQQMMVFATWADTDTETDPDVENEED